MTFTSSVPTLTRCCQYNIVRGSPRPTPATTVATTEVVNMLFDDQIVDTLCIFDNAESSRVVQDFNANAPSKRMNIWIDVDPVGQLQTSYLYNLEKLSGNAPEKKTPRSK